MEDNHAISEQPNAVNYEEEYNKLVVEFKKLENIADQLYKRVKLLENTWMFHRTDSLFKVVESNNFDPAFRQKAQNELENFLFPVEPEQKENKEV